MVEQWIELILQQAAKTFAAHTTTAGLVGAGKLIGAIGRKAKDQGISLSTETGEVVQRFRAWAETDPEWVAEVLAGLCELNTRRRTTPLANIDPAPSPFVDCDQLRQQIRNQPDTIYLITGFRGSGKSAVTYQLAQDLAEEFPRNRCYLNLKDFRAKGVVNYAQAFRRLLRQLGVPEDELADGEYQLEEQYREIMSTERTLLIVDNVRAATELERFAPGWSNVLVLATASKVTGDLKSTYQPIPMPRLSTDDARDLLASRRPGLREMIDAEPDATAELLNWFENMPGAIAEIAPLLDDRHGEDDPVAGLLAEFKESGITSLTELTARRLAATIKRLPAEVAALFPRLAALPAADFTRDVAEVLFGTAPRSILESLESVSLVTKIGDRYRLPGFVANYAQKIGDPAVDPLFDYYVAVAVAADVTESPVRLRRSLVPQPKPEWEGKRGKPIRWLDDNGEALAALVETAYHRERYEQACQLSTALEPLVQARQRYDLCLGAFEWGAKAARKLNRPGWERACARFLSLQARICIFRHEFDRALALLTEATALAGDDHLVQASIAEFTARYHEVRGGWELNLPTRTRHYANAETQLIRAVQIDRWLMANAAVEDDRHNARRGFGIHGRMLANVQAKLGKAREAQELLVELPPYLTDDRNRSRVHAVWAKVYVVLRDPVRAQTELDEARRLVEKTGSALNYTEELKDIEAEIRKVEGRIDDARAIWSELVQQALAVHHPKSEIFQAKLNSPSLPAPR